MLDGEDHTNQSSSNSPEQSFSKITQHVSHEALIPIPFNHVLANILRLLKAIQEFMTLSGPNVLYELSDLLLQTLEIHRRSETLLAPISGR